MIEQKIFHIDTGMIMIIDVLLTSMTLSIYSIYDYLSIFMCVTLKLEYNLMWKDMVWVRSSNFDDEFQYRFL